MLPMFEQQTALLRQTRTDLVERLRSAGMPALSNLVASVPLQEISTLAREVGRLINAEGQRLTFG